MAKVLLLDSPSWKLFNPKMHTHLGILYLAGSLRAAGHDVKVLDCHRVTGWDGKNLILHKEMMEPCDVLGLSATTANVNWGSEMAEAWPAKIKVLGGSHVSHIFEGPHERFKQRKYFPIFDYLMIGECEESFVAFCDSVSDGTLKNNLGRIPGLVWFDALGVHHNPSPSAPDVTKIPGPAFDLWEVGFEKGGISSASVTGKSFDANNMMTASLYTARGCPYGCTFCADARTKLREETIAQIEKQAAQLASIGVQAIRIQDDTFSIKKERCEAISDILNAYGMKWRACTRVNLKDRKLFDYLSAHGCTELAFGIEHGSGKMLKAMNKGTTPEANEAGIKMAQDSGIIARAYMMIGFPGETEETIEELEEWVLRVKPDAIIMSLFTPFPGSDVFNHPERYGVTIPDGGFERFWQLGGENDPDGQILTLPTISKERLFYHRHRLIKLFEKEIGALDRTQILGNVGTFGPRIEDGGLNSQSMIG
jgi:anaerobic magnesium-protoporphyrin IX monomethyl ester cyclase